MTRIDQLPDTADLGAATVETRGPAGLYKEVGGQTFIPMLASDD